MSEGLQSVATIHYEPTALQAVVIQFCRSDDVVVSNTIVGDGFVAQAVGGGTVTFAGDNTFKGTMYLGKGVLRIGTDSVGVAGNITSSAIGAGDLVFTANDVGLSSSSSSARDILNEVGIQGAAINFGDTAKNGKLTFKGGIQLYTTVAMTVGSDVEFSGEIGNETAGFGITKEGSGKLTLSGVNTYSGATTVNAGSFELSSGGALLLDINSAGATSSSIVLNGGSLLLDGSLNFDLTDAGFGKTTVISGAAYGENFKVYFGYGSDKQLANESAGVWSYRYNYGSGSADIAFTESSGELEISAIPEPCTLTMLILGVFTLIAYAWRRRR